MQNVKAWRNKLFYDAIGRLRQLVNHLLQLLDFILGRMAGDKSEAVTVAVLVAHFRRIRVLNHHREPLRDETSATDLVAENVAGARNEIEKKLPPEILAYELMEIKEPVRNRHAISL